MGGSLWVWGRVSIHRKFQASVGYLVKLCHHDDNDNDGDDVMKAFYISKVHISERIKCH